MATVLERVRAGATLLDCHVPGWAGKIDRDRLDMEDCAGCVIGQTCGDYTGTLESFGLTDEQEVGYGFESSHVLEIETTDWESLSTEELIARNNAVDAEYLALKTAWIVERDARLIAAEEARIEALPADTCPLGSPL